MWFFSRMFDSILFGFCVLVWFDCDFLVYSLFYVVLSYVDVCFYYLLVWDVSKENFGYYYCYVFLWVFGYNRSWYKVVEVVFFLVGVGVIWLELDYQVYLNVFKVFGFVDDFIELVCWVVDMKSGEVNV